MRTAEEIASAIVAKVDIWPTPLRRVVIVKFDGETPSVVRDVADDIHAARIEAVEEFRRRALLACDENEADDCVIADAAERCWARIAALPALPEEP